MGYHQDMDTLIKSAADIDRFTAWAGSRTRLLRNGGNCTFGGADLAAAA